MAKTVSVLNQKGGVGKTTSAVNLAACIGDAGKRVLIADIDPQAPFHAIIIPRKHIKSAACITSENSGTVARVFEAAAKIAAEQGLDNGFRIVNNCGEDGGQTVEHIHFHMLGKRPMAWPPG